VLDLSAEPPVAPLQRARRLVLDLSAEVFGSDMDAMAQAIIGEPEERDSSKRTLATLRLRWQRRYGIALPGVQLRAVEGLPGAIRLLLDGEPIGPSDEDQRSIDPVDAREVPDRVVQAVDNAARLYLDRLVEPWMAANLGLSGSWMPLVRLLLSEQTTLTAQEALRAAVSSIEAGLSIVEAARRYRLNDVVRPLLWGQHDQHLRLQLPAEEDELAACLDSDSPVVPDALVARIHDRVNALLYPEDRTRARVQNAGAAGSTSAVSAARGGAVKGAIVVTRPDVRPWLRILIRPLSQSTPVLSEDEVLARAAP
jgi:hypothetical protein